MYVSEQNENNMHTAYSRKMQVSRCNAMQYKYNAFIRHNKRQEVKKTLES